MDTANLKKRGHTWYARLVVPPSLRAVVGKSDIVRSLKTRDAKEATRRKHRALAEMHAWLSRFAVEQTLPKESADYVLATARSLRESVERGETTERAAYGALDAALEDHLKLQARKKGVDPESGYPPLDEAHERTLRLASQVLAHGDVVLLSESIAKYLKEIEPRVTKATYAQKDRQLHAFAKWLGGDSDVTTITKKVAGRYAAEVVQASELATKTKKDWLGNLSAFWTWLDQYGLVESNPWHNMTRTVKDSTRGGRKKKRPFTPDEFTALVKKLRPGSSLLPLACIAAYSGMRIEEIAAMKVEHLTDDAFRVMEGKTENSVRYVPLHSVIRPMVACLADTSSDGYLISGLLSGGVDGKRSHYASKQFGRFLRRNGFADGTLDFHSLRRSFTQRCEHAGIPEPTADLLTGHARQSLSYGLYSPGPEFPVLQKAMQKVSYGNAADALVKSLAKSARITVKSTRRRRAASRGPKRTSGAT